jgi:hypothetical protein
MTWQKIFISFVGVFQFFFALILNRYKNVNMTHNCNENPVKSQSLTTRNANQFYFQNDFIVAARIRFEAPIPFDLFIITTCG